MAGGAWRRRTAARGLWLGPNETGVASIPEDVADFTRRSEWKASEGPGWAGGCREVKANDGKQWELRKIAPSPLEEQEPGLATRGLWLGLNETGVTSIPEDVVDFTRRSESKASEWPIPEAGTREAKATRWKAAKAVESRVAPGRHNRSVSRDGNRGLAQAEAARGHWDGRNAQG